jgi:hypothetical protein
MRIKVKAAIDCAILTQNSRVRIPNIQFARNTQVMNRALDCHAVAALIPEWIGGNAQAIRRASLQPSGGRKSDHLGSGFETRRRENVIIIDDGGEAFRVVQPSTACRSLTFYHCPDY